MSDKSRSYVILEDDTDLREDLAEALTFAGHKVRAFGDFALVDPAAFETADILLLDLALPTVDGIGVLKRLKKLNAHAPNLILMSGSGEEMLRAAAAIARSLGLKILGTLSKPFAPEDVQRLSEIKLPPHPPPAPGHLCRTEEILPALREAVAAGTVPVTFQPIVSCQKLQFAGAEALLGDTLPGYGPVKPQELIEAASLDPDLLCDLTIHVLRHAAAARKAWGDADAQVSINIPLTVLERSDIVPKIASICREAGLPTKTMMLELTEDSVYASSPTALSAIAQLRLAGFGVALDDVAQRNSGLLQLSALPINEIKIDLELMREARLWEKARSIFTTLTELGHRLGLNVVAEGVESLEDLALARRAGVDYIQGYLVSRKRPLPELLAMQNMLRGTCEPWVEPKFGGG